ncbi:helix-turn-helix domain-containing protein [Streptomyces stelliscabiei]|uniref:helix-turn-helix domain-containing protein n=1 Tax=Streptomyces stelliscabiei TaxID=146820 RepID=UPI0029AE75CB|nr:helix-turn-helix domain-containing protein [Streptomyces stelliscabiei]MDX2550173.1 helix-turn-helix domain-containing protein [Streptomyces stelliscabiei]
MRDYKPGAQLTGQAREKVRAEAARLYETGMTVDAVAAAIGRSHGGTHTLLHEAGVQMRKRGGSNRKADA